ncbi:MAG: hypothetical protein M1830_004226, partial [Pleopsidium flavum]
QTLVVLPLGCPAGFPPTCGPSRGWLFNNSLSTTWADKGTYILNVGQNLQANDSGDFGFDSIGVGAQGTGGPTLDHQLLGGIATDTFYVGIFGLNPRATNYSGFNDPVPSYITSLKRNGSIPSVSFGYTAGAPYRLKGVTGSLTLGGYDVSRFTSNNLSFTFADDSSRDVVVGLQSITTDGSSNKTSLLSDGIFAFVDSTDPYISLPPAVCQKFEERFGLTWDNASQLYLVNETLHESLVSRNPNFTFTLGNSRSGGQTVDIVLPYSSFDLVARYPLNYSRFFPLKKVTNETQYTLGRAFLQEAYLIVDWERANFSISQCVFKDVNPQRIVTISPVETSDSTAPSKGQSLSTGAIVAIAISVVFFSLGLFALALAIFFVRRKRRRTAASAEATPVTEVKKEPENEVYPKAELDANNGSRPHEVGMVKPYHIDLGSGTNSFSMSKHASLSNFDVITPASELPSPPMPLYEMPGEELSWPELTDTSEGPRYENAKARWKRKRAELSSHGQDNQGDKGRSGEDPVEISSAHQLDKRPLVSPMTEVPKAEEDVIAHSSNQQLNEYPFGTVTAEVPKAGENVIAPSNSQQLDGHPLVSPRIETPKAKEDVIGPSTNQQLNEYPFGIATAEAPKAGENVIASSSSQQLDEHPLVSPRIETPKAKEDVIVLSTNQQLNEYPFGIATAEASNDKEDTIEPLSDLQRNHQPLITHTAEVPQDSVTEGAVEIPSNERQTQPPLFNTEKTSRGGKGPVSKEDTVGVGGHQQQEQHPMSIPPPEVTKAKEDTVTLSSDQQPSQHSVATSTAEIPKGIKPLDSQQSSS